MTRGKKTVQQIRRRLLTVFVFTVLLMAALIFRLGWIQFVMAEELQLKAWEQWNRSIPARSSRGDIFDVNGNLLAGSASVETVVALPPQINDPLFTARTLAPVLDMTEERIVELITQERAAVYLKRRVDEDVSREVRLLGLPGISFTLEPKRYYPNANLFSQLLGFVGTDQGWAGLEIFYEEELEGQDGSLVFPTDNKGREIPGVRRFVPPKEGKDLYLTVDETIQFIVERELSRAMVEYKPKRAMALAVNPQTGEVLAAASKPDFDPNRYNEYDNEYWRLFPVTDTFEPGSTLKLITLSAALEENLFQEKAHLECKGSVQVAGRTIRCWTSDRGGHGQITYAESVYHSCNPAFIYLGEDLGAETLFKYFRAFGLGYATGVDYPGEGRGQLFRPDQIGPLELATSSFGQGISVTPMQQVMAVSAFANGGYLLRPYFVKEIIDRDGSTVYRQEPRVIRQVVSEETAKTVARLMEGVIVEGSGVNAGIEGYRVAGKTGTAQKVSQGGYVPGEYVLSFIGFAPAEDPQVLLYVAVDGAQRGPQWGSQVSAPLFHAMMKDILSYLEIPPDHLPEEEDVEAARMVDVPDLSGLSIDEAGALLDNKGLLVRLVGEVGLIVAQQPQAGSQVPVQSRIILYLDDLFAGEELEAVKVPDLQGLTIKEAGEILTHIGLKMEKEGSGIVFEQEPAPGTHVNRGSSITVHFSSPLN